MSAFTDDQACVEAAVYGHPWQHRKTIPAWAAQDADHAKMQRDAVREAVRAEVGPDLVISVRITPGYCESCQRGAPADLPSPTPSVRALAVMIVAIARHNGYQESTGRHTAAEVREAWQTVVALASR